MAYAVEHLEAQPALGIRVRTRIEEIGDRIGAVLPRLMEVAGEHAAGPVLARWHSWEGDTGEMEVAVPVAPGAQGAGDVVLSQLPAGRAVVTWHVGSYDGLKDAWKRLKAWMADEGLEGGAAPWEEYVSDCAVTPPEELRTRIVWPLA